MWEAERLMNDPKQSIPPSVLMALTRRAQSALRRQGRIPPLRRRSEINNGLSRHAHPQLRMPQWVKPIAAALLAVGIFTSVFSYALIRDLGERIEQRRIDISQFQKQPVEVVDDYSGRSLNILIIGSDTREGEGNSDFGSPDEDYGMRSDTTIIMHVSEDRQRVQFVSIPRDTMVEMPDCELADGTMVRGDLRQFNAAFSYGGGPKMNLASAVNCTKKTVEAMSGLTIDEFVVLDFAGFESLVDALGGVDICLDEDIEDELADLKLKAGCQHIDGYVALGLARSRHSTEDGSDLSRIDRQQYLMMEIVNTALNKSLLTDLPTLYSFLREGIATVHTSPALSNLSTSAGLARSVKGIPTKDFQFVTMPWEEYPWDSNRVQAAQAATGVWEALKNDAAFPPGTKVKAADGTDGLIGDDGLIKPEDEATASEDEQPTYSHP